MIMKLKASSKNYNKKQLFLTHNKKQTEYTYNLKIYVYKYVIEIKTLKYFFVKSIKTKNVAPRSRVVASNQFMQ